MMRTAILAVTLAVLAALAAPLRAADDFFSRPDHLWVLHLRLSKEAWQKMQPAMKPRFEPRRVAAAAPKTQPATRPAAAAASADHVVRSPFGHEFTAVPGALQFGDDAAEASVAVRFKGNLTYQMSANTPRRPMKIEFDRPDKQRRVHGLATLNLNPSPTDPSHLREYLAFGVFRDAGLPAPRTAFALVCLTVDGLYAKQNLGIYTVIEDVDRDFLRRHFADADSGLLLKPEMMRGLPYLGHDWAGYAERYNPKGKASKKERAAWIEFLRLLHFADDATFNAQIAQHLDIEHFLRFIAVQASLSNFDSFLCTGHNYYLYRHPRDGRLRWIAWDQDLSFGGFPVVASPQQQINLSLLRPHVPPNRLIERLLAHKPFAAAYERQVRQVNATAFTPERLRQRILAAQPLLSQARAAGRPISSPPGLEGSLPVEQFLAARFPAIAAQLAHPTAHPTAHPGFVPAGHKDLGIRFMWPEHRQLSLANCATVAAQRTFLPPAADRIALEPLLQQAKSRLPQPLARQALNDALADALPIPQHMLFDPGPGVEWAGILLRIADADKDGQLTADELAAALTAAFATADANKNGALEPPEFYQALLKLAAP